MARNTTSAGAREQARKLQQEQERKQKRQSLLLRIGVVGIAVIAVVAIALVVLTRDGNGGNYTEGPAPAAATDEGGFVLTSSTELAEGADLGTIDAEDTPSGDAPASAQPREEGQRPHLTIFTDAHCVHCANFEGAYEEILRGLLDEELITLEYRSVAYLQSRSNYSARAANAFACMADASPENYKGYLSNVTANYQGQEINNESLAAIARDSYGVDIESCINDATYRAFVAYVSNTAWEQGVSGTPTIYVDDSQYEPNTFFEALMTEVSEYAEEAGIESDFVQQAEEQLDAEDIGQSESEEAPEDAGSTDDGEDE